MKTILSLLVLVLATSSSFSTSWTISHSGNTFSPSTITIGAGDDVTFSLASVHNAVEVSQATWNSNGFSALGTYLIGTVDQSKRTVRHAKL